MKFSECVVGMRVNVITYGNSSKYKGTITERDNLYQTVNIKVDPKAPRMYSGWYAPAVIRKLKPKQKKEPRVIFLNETIDGGFSQVWYYHKQVAEAEQTLLTKYPVSTVKFVEVIE